jgi:hypothetical protein
MRGRNREENRLRHREQQGFTILFVEFWCTCRSQIGDVVSGIVCVVLEKLPTCTSANALGALPVT